MAASVTGPMASKSRAAWDAASVLPWSAAAFARSYRGHRLPVRYSSSGIHWSPSKHQRPATRAETVLWVVLTPSDCRNDVRVRSVTTRSV